MADTRFCERCQQDVPRVGIHPCTKAERPVSKIEEGLKEALAIAKGEAKPARVTKIKVHGERGRAAMQPEALTSTVEAKKPAKATPNKVRKPKATKAKALPIAPLPISLPIKEAPAVKAVKSNAQRQTEWRERNRAKHNGYMRDYLRKYRATRKPRD